MYMPRDVEMVGEGKKWTGEKGGFFHKL